MWSIVLIVFAVTVATYILAKIGSKGLKKVKFYSYFFIFYISGSLLACIIWPIFMLRPKNVLNSKLAANILKHVTKIYGLKWELRGKEILSEDRGAVVVSNHQSTLDVLGMFNIWDTADKVAAIAKKEVFYVWPFGLAAYLAGVVFIDRSNAKGAYQQLQVTSEVMIKNKTKLWLFPEGTRNKDCKKLLPFKKGAFAIAIHAQTPIIPVVFSPYYFINEKKYIFNEGHVVIQCLDPIPTKGLTMDDALELQERVRNVMENTYLKLTQEVLKNLPSDYPHSLTNRE